MERKELLSKSQIHPGLTDLYMGHWPGCCVIVLSASDDRSLIMLVGAVFLDHFIHCPFADNF